MKEKYEAEINRLTAERDGLKGQYDALRDVLARVTAEQDRQAAITNNYGIALQEIKERYGKVCDDYESCTHIACWSSYSAWATADGTLYKRGRNDQHVP